MTSSRAGIQYPDDWVELSFRRVAYVAEGLVDPTVDPWKSAILIAPNHIESGTGRIAELVTADEQGADSGKYRVRAGDVVFSKIRPKLNKSAIAPVDGLCSADMYPIRLRQGDSQFALYWMLAKPFNDYVGAISDRVKMPKVNRAELAGAPWVVPPLQQQQAIRAFLDRETAKIDALVEKQTLLIERLRERRTALVLSAVTGADRHQDLALSGLFWAPRTPAKWGIKPLKRLVSEVQTGVWGADEDGGPGDIPCVRVADFDRRRLEVRAAPTIRSVSDADRRKCELRRHDLLIEKSGGTAINPVGFVAAYASDEPAVFANFIARLRMRDDQNPRYWLYALHGSYAGGLTWRSVKQTTGIQNLDLDAFLSEPFPAPSPSEQQEIVDRLDHETAKIDTLIEKTERMIELSRERRAALITAAVTGQIDVTKGTAA